MFLTNSQEYREPENVFEVSKVTEEATIENTLKTATIRRELATSQAVLKDFRKFYKHISDINVDDTQLNSLARLSAINNLITSLHLLRVIADDEFKDGIKSTVNDATIMLDGLMASVVNLHRSFGVEPKDIDDFR